MVVVGGRESLLEFHSSEFWNGRAVFEEVGEGTIYNLIMNVKKDDDINF